jgi:hypothetical protein
MRIYRNKNNNIDYYKISQIIRKYKKKDHPYVYLELKEMSKEKDFIEKENLENLILEEEEFLKDHSSIEFLTQKKKKEKKYFFLRCWK